MASGSEEWNNALSRSMDFAQHVEAETRTTDRPVENSAHLTSPVALGVAADMGYWFSSRDCQMVLQRLCRTPRDARQTDV